MNKDKQSDAFTDHVMQSINPEILNSLSLSQISAIENAIKATHAQKKHMVDFRGAVNLLFDKFYFVFLMGRDRRVSAQKAEIERRAKAALLGNIFFIVLVISPFILLTIVFIYLLKVLAGIDLLPGEHTGWIIGL
jgi:hypothetical protein